MLNDLIELAKFGGAEGEAVIVAALSYPIQGYGASNSQLVISNVPGCEPMRIHGSNGSLYIQLDLSAENYGLRSDHPEQTAANRSIILGHELGHWYFGTSDPLNVVTWKNVLRSNYNLNGSPVREEQRSAYGNFGLYNPIHTPIIEVPLLGGGTRKYIFDVKTVTQDSVVSTAQ